VIQPVPVNGLISLNYLIIKAFYAILPAGFGFGTEFDIRIGLRCEIFEKRSVLVKVKEGDNFNHRNIFNISRIEI